MRNKSKHLKEYPRRKDWPAGTAPEKWSWLPESPWLSQVPRLRQTADIWEHLGLIPNAQGSPPQINEVRRAWMSVRKEEWGAPKVNRSPKTFWHHSSEHFTSSYQRDYQQKRSAKHLWRQSWRPQKFSPRMSRDRDFVSVDSQRETQVHPPGYDILTMICLRFEGFPLSNMECWDTCLCHALLEEKQLLGGEHSSSNCHEQQPLHTLQWCHIQ